MSSSSHLCLHVIIHGRVQGVGFRVFTSHEAETLGLTGWVRNLPSEAVEVVAEGAQEALDVLLARLRLGPSASRVTHIDVKWGSSSGEFSGFRIH